jgi:hypothetical protein
MVALEVLQPTKGFYITAKNHILSTKLGPLGYICISGTMGQCNSETFLLLSSSLTVRSWTGGP